MSFVTKHRFKRLCTYAIKRRGTSGIFSMAVIPEIRVDGKKEQFCYYDGERGHMLDGKVLTATDTQLSFEWISGADGKMLAVLSMRPITMPEFNLYYRAQIDPYRRFIHDLEDLSTFMLRRTPKG